MFALGYDGRVFVLHDSDGDGLEDKAEIFWDKPTISVPVGMAVAPEGVYVSSHGKVSLLHDTDHDGKADVEEIIASGWPPTDVGSGGVDATAVVRDAEGNLYFGLLTADYSNAYRIKDGKSHYDLNGPRGTIQKWSVATKKLVTIATGIRVPYTLAFNRHGDLFVTDQEGETWMPNGNPLDELNHIIPGRNYGFPPPHEKYLPGLISEPPVVAFGPQHQSTCGFLFNERTVNRKSFGPDWWEGDAIIVGESRGKIWRARLVKTAEGYVGKETTIARLNMLTTDVALSPKGDVYVSCHSGPPDWGTGPQGEGKLFKISFTDGKAPQPVIAWAAGPMEVRVAFDRPLADSVTNDLVGKEIEFGEFVRAGDRFEVLKPPYQAVKFQDATPRGKLRIAAAHLSADKTGIALTTDPHPLSVTYALTMPAIKGRGANAASAIVDLDYNLNGVEAKWRSKNVFSSEGWDGCWFPHIDSEVNQAFTAQSTWHRMLSKIAEKPGVLTLRSQIKLPPGKVTLRFQRNAPFHAIMGSATSVPNANAHGWFLAELKVPSDGQPQPIELELETGSTRAPIFHASYFTESDPTLRPLPFSFFLLPWAAPYQPLKMPEGPGPDLAGGDWQRGKTLFTSEQLKCGACHKVRGEGKETGPDLSNLIHRDAASVLRDIKEPNASINPDYVAYKVTLKNGGELTGFVRAQSGNAVRVVDADGKETVAPRANIKEMQPSSVSLMPVGLLEGLREGQVRDLLTYLLIAEPPKPKMETPPRRTRAEVEAILAVAAAVKKRTEVDPKPSPPPHVGGYSSIPRVLKLVLVASKQDHGPGEHDYPAWQTNWTKLLNQVTNVNVATAWEWPGTEQFKQADVMV
ncbi:MAG TPA: c-type cytochrome, partial [Candidatus Eisenbacteria bacterium]|nr:c-type cytochrome [Candidatus Eisenbacteria bacterium]